MTIFVLVTENDNETFFQKVQDVYPDDESVCVDKNIILIHSEKDGLASQVSDKIQGEDKALVDLSTLGRHAFFSIDSYHGWHYMSMWDWLKSKGL